MPSFVIDEVYVGDIVSGDAVLRNVSFGEEPVYTLPYFPDEEPPRMNPVVPEPLPFPSLGYFGYPYMAGDPRFQYQMSR